MVASEKPKNLKLLCGQDNFENVQRTSPILRFDIWKKSVLHWEVCQFADAGRAPRGAMR